jgi:anionic cell wall polymer biosynthesis LytR-Cps2A-Psr (LCP) family protein
VDAVGGVDVNNTEKLYDSAYPCDNNRAYCPFSLPAGQYHMNGTLALKYARCRHGSCGNDFGRAARQQQLLAALRQKALTAATLTNPVKLSSMINTVGDHARTDLQLAELKKLGSIIKDVDMSKATTKVLSDAPDGLLVEGGNQFPGAGSILLPKAGPFVYDDIQELAHSIFVDAYLKKEAATVEVRNATSRSGLGATVTKQLQAYSYNVIATTTAPQSSPTSQIIDYTGGKKPYTVKYLQNRFKAAVQTAAAPPADGQTHPDVVIIVGSDYKLSTTTR